MRVENQPYNYPIDEHFPIRRLLAEFEGGVLYLSEKDDKFYIISDEGTMADFLLPEDKGLLSMLVTIYEFDTKAEREKYIQERCWGDRPSMST